MFEKEIQMIDNKLHKNKKLDLDEKMFYILNYEINEYEKYKRIRKKIFKNNQYIISLIILISFLLFLLVITINSLKKSKTFIK
tara:strand:- start:73 stop:321 length:249 start_codon:yes stop_codon:yes gene_type:complete